MTSSASLAWWATHVAPCCHFGSRRFWCHGINFFRLELASSPPKVRYHGMPCQVDSIEKERGPARATHWPQDAQTGIQTSCSESILSALPCTCLIKDGIASLRRDRFNIISRISKLRLWSLQRPKHSELHELGIFLLYARSN